jgi:hypothetical protein
VCRVGGLSRHKTAHRAWFAAAERRSATLVSLPWRWSGLRPSRSKGRLGVAPSLRSVGVRRSQELTSASNPARCCRLFEHSGYSVVSFLHPECRVLVRRTWPQGLIPPRQNQDEPPRVLLKEWIHFQGHIMKKNSDCCPPAAGQVQVRRIAGHLVRTSLTLRLQITKTVPCQPHIHSAPSRPYRSALLDGEARCRGALDQIAECLPQ